LGDWADIVPVSAMTGFQLDVLTEVLVSHLPPGEPLYPEGELTDEPEQVLVAELIREAALEGVRDELPHSIAVVVDEMGPRAGRASTTEQPPTRRSPAGPLPAVPAWRPPAVPTTASGR